MTARVACRRKAARFLTEDAAERNGRQAELRLGLPSPWFEAYLCRACAWWHYGRSKKWVRRWEARIEHGPFDPTLEAELGERAYKHGRWEQRHPGQWLAWLTERVPKIMEARARQLEEAA